MRSILTRYLYAQDEVEAMLLTSLLCKNDICECYFWAYELIGSGIDLFAILWKIYYDIYFEYNTQLETYMRKKHIEWEKSRDDLMFANILNNMFHAKPSCKVFVLRQAALVNNRSSGLNYTGRRPKWCERHEKKYHCWLLAISKKDYRQIAYWTYYVVHECSTSDEVFDELIKYFGRYFTINNNTFAYWNDRKYNDDAHYLLAIIIQLLADVQFIVQNIKFKSPRDEHVKWIQNLAHNNSLRPYRILKQQRKYGVNKLIGSFILQRHIFDADLGVENINLYWEYFAYQTPIWSSRFNKYNAVLDNAKKRIVFKNDDDMEAFYDSFGLEPDEQSLEVQKLSNAEIPMVPWYIWFNRVFEEESIIDFKDNNMRFVI